jgi:hypothetical protein
VGRPRDNPSARGGVSPPLSLPGWLNLRVDCPQTVPEHRLPLGPRQLYSLGTDFGQQGTEAHLRKFCICAATYPGGRGLESARVSVRITPSPTLGEKAFVIEMHRTSLCGML